ncbi:MAG: TPM domain-containing protein [Rhodocyclaceae bacterium]|nr:TPM domain-containing protein [Rhodocyclaceae bacterium]
MHKIGAILAVLWLLVNAAAAQAPLPALTGRVNDFAGLLRAQERDALAARLATLERETGVQLGIVTLPTVKPETIEQFSIRLAEAWRLGRQGHDDGVIIVVAKEERALRIEVGYGLEGAIPDAVAKRIIEESIAPRFRQGDFYGGLMAGVAALESRVRGESAKPSARPGAKHEEPSLTMVAVAVVLTMLLRAFVGALLAALAFALFVYWQTASWLLGVAAFFVILLLMEARPVGVWHGGGGFRGGFGGGFRGGGGGFGGGGASGRW